MISSRTVIAVVTKSKLSYSEERETCYASPASKFFQLTLECAICQPLQYYFSHLRNFFLSIFITKSTLFISELTTIIKNLNQ